MFGLHCARVTSHGHLRGTSHSLLDSKHTAHPPLAVDCTGFSPMSPRAASFGASPFRFIRAEVARDDPAFVSLVPALVQDLADCVEDTVATGSSSRSCSPTKALGP